MSIDDVLGGLMSLLVIVAPLLLAWLILEGSDLERRKNAKANTRHAR